jgi:hypothetical protein
VAELRVACARVEGHVLQFGKRLHPGVPAASEHERQRGPASLGRTGGCHGIELAQDVVAQVDGLADGLEPDPCLGQAGDRQPGD